MRFHNMFSASLPRRALLGLALTTALAASTTLASADPVTLKVAFSADYFMSTPDLAKKWFGEIKDGFEKANPDVKVELVPIQGGYDDFLTKLSLMYSNPGALPDLAEVPAPELGQWVASDLLAPLDDQLATTDWWPKYVDPVKKEGTVDGKVYAVSQGVNTNALLFDKTLFAKANLPADWKPKTWNDILDAARAIKKSDPNVWPLWVLTGTAQGTQGVVLGALNLMYGSSDPEFYNQKDDKWVVDGKGIREVLDFYRTASAEGLLAPASQILNANGPGIVAPFLPKHQIGITLGGNYVPQIWNSVICGPCWPEGEKDIGIAPIPTSQGQAPGIATAFSGWSMVMAKTSPHPDLAWKLMNFMFQKDYALEVGNYGGLVPPIPAYISEKAYVDFAPSTQKGFADLLPIARSAPSNAGYKVWSFAIAQATETLVLHPDTSLDQAVKSMKDYVAGQLGDDKVETRN
jgi:multiple sugar transport system substrate-binding protein